MTEFISGIKPADIETRTFMKEFFVKVASVKAAETSIQNGADGIIFSDAEEFLGSFLSFARAFGVRTILDYSSRYTDGGLSRRLEVLANLYKSGLDAIICSDIGLLRLIKQIAPNLTIIWGLPIQSTDDISFAMEAGCSSAIISPFLSAEEIESLRKASEIPLMFWLVSPICPSESLQNCLLAERSEAPDCKKKCRELELAPLGEPIAPLLKTRDLSLLGHISKLQGLVALVEPPESSPEFAAVLTRFVKTALDENYFEERGLNSIFAAIGRPPPIAPPYTVKGGFYAPETPNKRPELWETITSRLAEKPLPKNITILKSDNLQITLPKREVLDYSPSPRLLPRASHPLITLKVSKISQISEELLAIPPERIYVPLDEVIGDLHAAVLLAKSQTVPVAVLPRIYSDKDKPEIIARLKILHNSGYREVLVNSPSKARFALEQGFTPRADWNASTSEELRAAKALGIASCTIAPWLTLSEVKQLSHHCDTELIAYGRLPLLLARKCLTKTHAGLCTCDNKIELSDGKGLVYPLEREAAHSTMIYHPKKIWLLPHKNLWRHIGLWSVRLDFTTENALECAKIMHAYAGLSDYHPHSATTTGSYIDRGTSRKKKGGRR